MSSIQTKDTLSPLKFLKNRHVGERLIVVANGPSLNSMDLRFLKRETCLGMNKIFLGFRKFHFYPRYYIAVNDKVLEQSEREIKALTSVKFLSKKYARSFQENALTYLIKSSYKGSFYHDITQGVREGGTVTFAALQVAYYLGFKEVVLIGLDHRYDYQGAPNETKIMKGPDENHFASNYFGFGQKWDNPDLAKSEQSYQLAKKVFEDDGRKIIDATLNGACTIFDKADYRELFGFK